MMVSTHIRIAVAEKEKENMLAEHLGRAVKFALFDVRDSAVRGPTYRVRHDNPGEHCDHQAELAVVLHDCQAVIAGAIGRQLAQRLQDLGIEAVATPERISPVGLVTKYIAGTLLRTPMACDGEANQEMRFLISSS